MKTCKDCKYRGCNIDHLDGVSGTDKWIKCEYPKPFYILGSATPYIVEGEVIEHDCICHIGANMKCPACGRYRDAPPKVFGCDCGYDPH